MAVYCGNLYVGYWPTGEIWRYQPRIKRWHLFARLFPETEDLEPYKAFVPPGETENFFGRRVTSLVVHDKHLYAATSNKAAWPSEMIPEGLSQDIIDRYGAVYRITDKGCSGT